MSESILPKKSTARPSKSKPLDEIEKRLKAATPAKKWLYPHAKHLNIDPGACWGSVHVNEADYHLLEQAPADLALLSRLVRLVCEAACESYVARPACHLEDAAASDELCWPCRIRRELARDVRA